MSPAEGSAWHKVLLNDVSPINDEMMSRWLEGMEKAGGCFMPLGGFSGSRGGQGKTPLLTQAGYRKAVGAGVGARFSWFPQSSQPDQRGVLPL